MREGEEPGPGERGREDPVADLEGPTDRYTAQERDRHTWRRRQRRDQQRRGKRRETPGQSKIEPGDTSDRDPEAERPTLRERRPAGTGSTKIPRHFQQKYK